MKNVGQKLKKARESQKLSITEISMATKISPKVLQSMEKGNLSQLPALSFLRGFVRTYASFLKLDAEELLVDFQKEYDEEISPAQEADPTGLQSEPNKTASSNDLHFIKEKSSTHLWLAAIGLIVLIGVVIGVNEVVEKYKKEATLVSPPEDLEKIVGSEPETDVDEASVAIATTPSASPTPQPTSPAEQTKTETEALAETPPAAPAKEVPEAPATAAIQAPSPVTKPIQTPTPMPNPAVAAPPVTAPPVTDKVAETAAPASPATPPAAEVKPKAEGSGAAQEVILEALDRVVVTFKINEGPTEKVTLFPDQVHTIKLRGKVALDFSDGGAINVIVNGRDRGVPGDLGKPKKVTFP